jgi:hypothetical protein
MICVTVTYKSRWQNRRISASSTAALALSLYRAERDLLRRPVGSRADPQLVVAAIRSIAGKAQWLFDGSHSGKERAATAYSILQTAKSDGTNRKLYYRDFAASQPTSRISSISVLPRDDAKAGRGCFANQFVAYESLLQRVSSFSRMLKIRRQLGKWHAEIFIIIPSRARIQAIQPQRAGVASQS